MNRDELEKRNVGENLDTLMNLDPRGYGVCRILYAGSRKATGEPLTMHAAQTLVDAVKPGDLVYILTGFVLLPHKVPEMDGMEALRRMKESAQTREVPVIFLTAKSSEVDKVRGLDLGAEDYITKPFGLLELAARVRAALRRQPAEHRQHRLTGGDLVIDLDNHEVTQSGRHLDLTLKEYELLRILLSNSSRVVPRDELLGEIWGFDFVGETNSVDVYIRFLRSKIDEAFGIKLIHTVRGVGYVIKEE